MAAPKDSKDIEEYLKNEKKQFLKLQKDPKVLLLGSSDSGKSTLLKQFKIMHKGGFEEQELKKAKSVILLNIGAVIGVVLRSTLPALQGLKAANQEIYDIGLEILPPSDDGENATVVQIRDDIKTDTKQMIDTLAKIIQLKEKYKALWENNAVRTEIRENAAQMYPETTEFFLTKLDDILTPDYVPCNEDILNMRVTTWAVSDTEFLIKNQNLHIYDVSGLKYHRKSWLQYFDHVNNIMFLASLSGYSQVLPEDPTVNRLVDSIVLFGDMVNHKLIKHIDIILFLNKIDLFKRKVKKVPISKFFPEYSGKKY